jgi:hypothetical protein
LYLHKLPISSLKATTGIGSDAICNLTSYLRQMLADSVNFEEVQVGDEGIIVEVD